MLSTNRLLTKATPAVIGFAMALGCSAAQAADTWPPFGHRALITEPTDEANRLTLSGNTRPEAVAENDRGSVADNLRLEHMILQLARPAEQEQAVRQYIDSLHDPASSNFHHWLSASEFGQTYGPSAADIQSVVSWLTSYGFTVNSVAPSGMTIDFSGTAQSVHLAFQTEIHSLHVNGVSHIANISDPTIPAALAPAVAGIVSLHDFTPHAKRRARANYTFTASGTTTQAVTPGDLATIYDITPLFAAGLTGKGQTIALIEDANLYSTADWTTFRSTFGLNKYTSGSLTTLHPSSATGSACSNPGLGGGDDIETTLDAEWASAAAPDAAIQVVSCGSTATTFGGLIALQNLVNGTSPPSIISISYGECEAKNGAASNAAFQAIYQQAAAEGISIFVSSGDEGAAGCDAGATGATHGIGVNAFASTPYNVAVGGTDFGDTAAGTNSTYWNTTNTATYVSAKSYIPEIPWNDSCASQLLATYFGFSTPYGASGFCASTTAQRDGLRVVAGGSGGPSGCATGIPSTVGVVGGTCAGYAKPSWQTGTGVPSDGRRDIPDVSLFAADGVWNHYYVICYSNLLNGGAACSGAPSQWAGAGGTSFASPILAGIQALVNQKTGSKQGNPNYVYYKLAAVSGKVCDASGTVGSDCVFHNVTKGDIDVDCNGTNNCYGSVTTSRRGGGSYTGVLSVSDLSYQPAYGTSSGWNFATGLGSIDAYNLVMGWTSVQ